MGEKELKYTKALDYINNLLHGETDAISMMATIVCVLKDSFATFSWVGFYRVVGSKLLKIGPYQGVKGCIEIAFDRGVCGKCATDKQTQIVGDVTKIQYHIACSQETRSEIVVPVFNNKKNLIAVLDVDSNKLDNFDELDKNYLESICALFEKTKNKKLDLF